MILGARNVEQLTDNLAAADLDLSAEQLDRLSEVSAPQADDYPYGPAGVGPAAPGRCPPRQPTETARGPPGQAGESGERSASTRSNGSCTR